MDVHQEQDVRIQVSAVHQHLSDVILISGGFLSMDRQEFDLKLFQVFLNFREEFAEIIVDIDESGQ